MIESATQRVNVDDASSPSESNNRRRVAYNARRWPSWTSSNFRTLVRCSALKSSTLRWIFERASVTVFASTGKSSPTRNVFIISAILSPPKLTNIGSLTDTKNRDAPASPWRPDLPLNWSSTRTLSWRSVPTTYRPPNASTCCFSSFKTSPTSPATASTAFLQARTAGALLTARPSAASATRSATPSSKSSSSNSTAADRAASTRSCVADDISSKDSSLPRTFSTSSPSPPRNRSSTYSLATSDAEPPSLISVPRPAMFVATVTAPNRPAWATTAPSLFATSGLALKTSQSKP